MIELHNEIGLGRDAPTPGVSGVIVIDKPLGLTSMDVCRRVRWRLVQGGAPKRVKVGHGGTLDPLATGVLVVLVGKATKMCDEVMAGRKRYETTIDLSAFSTTDDMEGEKTPIGQRGPCASMGFSGSSANTEHESPPPPGGASLGEGEKEERQVGNLPRADARPTVERVRAACARFVGTILQTPPAYSAIKVGGRRSYDLARQGKAVELAARPVEIFGIDVVEYAWPLLTINVECGKGVYIRSLARDLGTAMGVGGYLTSLRRTMVGRWTIEQARTIDGLPEKMGRADLLPIA